MIRSSAPLFLVALFAAAGTPCDMAAQASTVILVRHAEKADSTRDTELSTIGFARAEALKNALTAYPLSAIFVSEYRRTVQTAAPTAALHLVTPMVIPVRGKVPEQAAATAAAIRALPAGSAALVAGHSNTLGPIIAALGGPKLEDQCDDEFATIFVIDLTATTPRLLSASYGVPDAPTAVACHHTMRTP
jgi:phosphohistidine phosphatase SixA